MQNGPNSAPPNGWAPGDNNLGPQAAIQGKASWTATQDQSKEQGILSAMRAPHLWRVTVLGQNVTVDITYGTSSAIVLKGLQTPVRITVPGSCEVYATPLAHDVPLAAHAEVTCTPATSGCCDSECRKLVSGNAVNLDPLAARFVALEASVVRVGPADNFISVTLAALQEVSLVAGSALTSGGGFLEFEP